MWLYKYIKETCWDDPSLLLATTNPVWGLFAISMLVLGYISGIHWDVITIIITPFWMFCMLIGIITPYRWFVQKKLHNGFGLIITVRYNFKTQEAKIDK